MKHCSKIQYDEDDDAEADAIEEAKNTIQNPQTVVMRQQEIHQRLDDRETNQ